MGLPAGVNERLRAVKSPKGRIDIAALVRGCVAIYLLKRVEQGLEPSEVIK